MTGGVDGPAPVEQAAVELARLFLAEFRNALLAEQLPLHVVEAVMNRIRFGHPDVTAADLEPQLRHVSRVRRLP